MASQSDTSFDASRFWQNPVVGEAPLRGVINLSARPIPATSPVDSEALIYGASCPLAKPRRGIWRAEPRAGFLEAERAAARPKVSCVHSSSWPACAHTQTGKANEVF